MRTLTGALLAGNVSPSGEPAAGGLSYGLTNRPINALYGRVDGESFFLGGEAAVLAPASGALELLVNGVLWRTHGMVCTADAGFPTMCVQPEYCDVQGSFSATVRAPLSPLSASSAPSPR